MPKLKNRLPKICRDRNQAFSKHSRVENEYKTELDTLMTPKFQDLKKVQLLAL